MVDPSAWTVHGQTISVLVFGSSKPLLVRVGIEIQLNGVISAGTASDIVPGGALDTVF